MNYGYLNIKRQLTAALIFSFISGCGLFLSPFNQQSYQYFIELKVLHIKFIETYSEGNLKTYNIEKIEESYNVIDLKFREAIEYQEQITEDDTRLTALTILREEFEDNYKLLNEQKEFFSGFFSDEIIKEISQNYNSAIKGELSRRKIE